MRELTTISHGATFEIRGADTFSHIQQSWRLGRFYEQKMLDELSSRYSGGSFIDVGASVGNHTVFFGLCCGAEKVHAFEPVKKSFDHMWENVTLNGLRRRVVAHNIALGMTECVGSMEMPEGGNEGMWKFRPELVGMTSMDRLDSFEIDDVTLIKIDAEGYESDILFGGIETIKAHKPSIVAEADTESDLWEIMAILKPLGYKVLKRYNATPTYEIVA